MRTAPRRPVACTCLMALGTAVLPGCGPVEPIGTTASPVVTMADHGVEEQIAAVRSGDSDVVVAREPLSDTAWESLRGLAGLRELVLEQGRADDHQAEILATLPRLERLVLRHSPLGDDGFRRLVACESLRDLNVPQAGCTALGVRALAALPKLRSLRLGGPHLAGPEVCEAIAGLGHLRSLHLIDVPIGDDGLMALARLTGLWNLYLDGAGVSDGAWERYFQSCPKVHVHVDQAHHDRDPLGHPHEQAP